jgi:hypothetical protein
MGSVKRIPSLTTSNYIHTSDIFFSREPSADCQRTAEQFNLIEGLLAEGLQ